MRAEFAVHDGLLLNAGVTLSRNWHQMDTR
jgi:hypothetical protein